MTQAGFRLKKFNSEQFDYFFKLKGIIYDKQFHNLDNRLAIIMLYLLFLKIVFFKISRNQIVNSVSKSY